MAREVSLGGVGKNPSIDRLTRVSPAQFTSIAKKQLEADVIRTPNSRAYALPRTPFSGVISSAFRNETAIENVFRLMSQRFKRLEGERFLAASTLPLKNTIADLAAPRMPSTERTRRP